ncbi:apoptosis regulator BAX-like [Dreissena polymorpha]|uniref:Bcl-2 Bcl-2 homology region 1-3 domain-containing protein n=1 Tax=Dreissena polymorpha TaxID=45954 RepID=A0A9D4N3Z9_DREPO|nr:apoptosis regulator BAX-like [Dreissena polymorpha]KAH3887438.1 hypothetical protein DPMN_011455 [Dreissena polymorpha]
MSGDSLKFQKHRTQRQLSKDDIANQSRLLLHNFIGERLEKENVEHKPKLEDLQEPGTPSGPPLEHFKEIGSALRFIADELDQDKRIHNIIDKVPPNAPRETFFNVANDFFLDGVISWGRVATLFYFGYKMILKALDKVALIRAIINWVINFIVDKFAPWIISRGGWEAIREYFGTPGWQVAGVLIAGLTVAGAVVAYGKR